MFTKKSHLTILFLFVTFLVMNPIFFFGDTIALIGKYGKLVTALGGIILLQKSDLQIKNFVSGNVWLILFWCLCIFFVTLHTLEFGMDFELIQNNVLFIVFIYFLYVLSVAFKIRHRRPNYSFFKYLAFALNINFIFWLIITLILGLELWSEEGDRIGLDLFYDSYISLGIFSCTGAIANFAAFKAKTIKTGKLYFAMFILYLILIILANSRNAQLILGVFLLFSIWPYLGQTVVKISYFVVIVLSIAFTFYFSGEMLLDQTLKDFTTGRSSIWYYVYKYYVDHSILIGKGIFGLNDTILIANTIDSNYYLSKIDRLYFHSSYLEAMTAAGLIGLVFFLLFIIKSLRQRRKNYVVFIIISILVGALFESYLVQPTILISFLFWYLIVGQTTSALKTEITSEE